MILVSEYADFAYAQEAIVNGAFDYIVKPVDNSKLKESMDRAYDYIMGSAVTGLSYDTESMIDGIAEMIAKNDSTAVYSSGILMDRLEKKYVDLSQRTDAAEHVLLKIGEEIYKRKKYISKYADIPAMCHLTAETGEQLREAFTAGIGAMMKEVNKFSINTHSQVIQRIYEYIVENIEEPLNLSIISEEFFINKKYLSSLFKQEIGEGFVEFVTYVRIERAKMLLREPGIKVYEVATKLGFTDVEYFSKVFKRSVGVSPGQYRKELLCGEDEDS